MTEELVASGRVSLGLQIYTQATLREDIGAGGHLALCNNPLSSAILPCFLLNLRMALSRTRRAREARLGSVAALLFFLTMLVALTIYFYVKAGWAGDVAVSVDSLLNFTEATSISNPLASSSSDLSPTW